MNVPQAQQNLVTDDDPTIAQRRASDPRASVWVQASAGSGKTKVLTDRVLRLLLPGQDGTLGAPAHKILCLTFTKAGAGEMAIRLGDRLAHWAAIESKELIKDLSALLGHEPTPEQKTAARQLLFEVLDTPGGLQIVTIHAFCQSILGRFALESGLKPGFTVLEENDAKDLLARAREDVLAKALAEPGSSLYEAFETTAQSAGEERFDDLLKTLVSERHRLAYLPWGTQALKSALAAAVGVPMGLTLTHIVERACADSALDAPALRSAAQRLMESKKPTSTKRGGQIMRFLATPEFLREGLFEEYCDAFLTKDDQIVRTILATQDVADALPALEQEAQRLEALQETLRAARCAQASFALLLLCHAILERYDALKALRGVLDYDDLILKTLALLNKSVVWVHYKLDQGIDHILIDEAQDTNPEQWAIIEALSKEFFAGLGARSLRRTLFVVGDAKQSIFGFQRAAPQEFSRMHTVLAERTRNAKGVWVDVPMHISFRSAPTILTAVDAVFGSDGIALGQVAPCHKAYRSLTPGFVEIWPLLEADKGAALEEEEKEEEQEENVETSFWSTPFHVRIEKTGAQKMAEHIAQAVETWLLEKEPLPSTGKSPEPGDILILVRSRGTLAPLITRALKNAGVPVAGADRLCLAEHLAVQDLMTAARFALLPQDDLNLACLLKSPLINWNEDALFAVTQGRKGHLWDILLHIQGEEVVYLKSLIAAAKGTQPFAFFTHVLESVCPSDPKGSGRRALLARLGPDALEPMEELLSQSLSFTGSDSQNAPLSLEAFIADFESRPKSAIKRESESKASFVRVMTIHGAKGLESPIVVLPDTILLTDKGQSKASSRLLWGNTCALWAPDGKAHCATFLDLHTKKKDNEKLEEGRLAYVAMTRAQDRLYIGGYKGQKREPKPESWYLKMREAIENMQESRILPDGTVRFASVTLPPPETGATLSSHPPEREGLGGGSYEDSSVKSSSYSLLYEGPKSEVPPWAYIKVPLDPQSGPPLYPSRLAQEEEEEEIAASSPLFSAGREGAKARVRGDVMHALFQYLPSLPPDMRRNAALSYVEARGIGAHVAKEALDTLENPLFADIFGSNALAEVAIVGTLEDGRSISGRIDRLLIEPKCVTIVDFKTGRLPGDREPPELYKRQMAAYRSVVAKMYPTRRVRTALLYTAGPKWVEIYME